MRGYQPGPPRETPELKVDIAWVLGFLSGIGFKNENGDDPPNGTDAGGVFSWIDIYCPESLKLMGTAALVSHARRPW